VLTIRRYAPADHEAVCALHVDALAATGGFAGRGPWDADLDDIERGYLRDGEFLVGHESGQLLAMGALRPVPSSSPCFAPDQSGRAAEIKRMRVRPGHQGHGHGTAILGALLTRASELGYEVAVLDTVAGSAAEGFYTRHGFGVTGHTVYLGFDVVLMSISLTPALAPARELGVRR
jgi:GNAT superfamily N-acetyltransferase